VEREAGQIIKLSAFVMTYGLLKGFPLLSDNVNFFKNPYQKVD
jgi:hypothetical protein